MTVDQVRTIVADMLVRVGHGNALFIQSMREGGQDDGPYMQAALAVRDQVVVMLAPTPEEEPDG
jgi:hypothetical protein